MDVRASDPDGTVVGVDMYYQPYPGSPPTVGLQHVVMTYQTGNGIWQGYMGNTTVGTTWPLPALAGYSTSPYVVITDNGGKTTKVTTTVTVTEVLCQ